MGNRILPLPERSRNQTPPGIGQLPEQTLRNTGHVGDDKAQLFPRSADLMIAAVGDVSDANLVDYTRAGILAFGLGSSLYSDLPCQSLI